MKITNVFKHPNDTPAQRAKRMNDLLQPVLREIVAHPEIYGTEGLEVIPTEDILKIAPWWNETYDD